MSIGTAIVIVVLWIIWLLITWVLGGAEKLDETEQVAAGLFIIIFFLVNLIVSIACIFV